MFTFAACAAVVLIAWHCNRINVRERPSATDDARQSRQDVRLITYLLTAILVALGIIADHLH